MIYLISTDESATERIKMFTTDARTGHDIFGTWSQFANVFVCQFEVGFAYWTQGAPITITENRTGAKWEVFLSNLGS